MIYEIYGFFPQTVHLLVLAWNDSFVIQFMAVIINQPGIPIVWLAIVQCVLNQHNVVLPEA